MAHIVVLGNGIAGITAARHIRKLGKDEITVISGESDHFFSRTALMYIYMGHMTYEHTKPYEDWFWDKNNIKLLRAWVTTIDFQNQQLTTDDYSKISYDKLIIATGSLPNKFGWPGQDLKGVQGLYHLQDLETMEAYTPGIKNAVVVGGGLIGVEMAEMLHSKGIHVTFLIRESHFWGNVLPPNEATLISKHLKDYNINLLTETELDSILDDGTGSVQAITTKSGETIPCQFVGLTVGVHPNIDLFKNTHLGTEKGILVDDYLQTNLPNVYAVGDCAQLRKPLPHRKSIEAVWYTGRMMGETVAQTITGNPTKYQPGVWFNSAKFFDIEYQTYGNVPARLSENQQSFYWQAENENKCINIVFNKSDKTVIGINSLGIRQRHDVWDKWLKQKNKLPEVIANLQESNFDPEFFRRYEPEIQQLYNSQFDEQISIGKQTFFQKLFNPTN